MARLVLVPTPIGNLEDITYRAVRLLKEAQLVIAEDTRTSGNLMRHYGITNRMTAFHQHNEHRVVQHLVEKILDCELAVLITDAGTPGISDPGFLLIRECLLQNVEVECLPGPTALIPALVSSGLPSDHFVFEGFLPPKKGRTRKLNFLAEQEYTIVLYESPHKLLRTLEDFVETFGPERKICVARELTKIHEELFRGTVSEALSHFQSKAIKGEIVIVVAGK